MHAAEKPLQMVLTAYEFIGFPLFFLENVSVGLPTWKYFWLASKVKKLVLMKLYHIPQKENFHEKIFENSAIPRGVVLFLELKKKFNIRRNVNSGICLKRKETKMSAPVQFQAMPDLEKSTL